MMNDARICAVMDAIGEKLQEQQNTIFFQKHEIDRLRSQLAEAEKLLPAKNKM